MARRFQSADKKYGLELPDSEFDRVIGLCKSSNRSETGGLLVGYYSEDMSWAVVKAATAAPPDSKAGRSWFHRGVKGISQYLQTLWKDQKYYLGEWHFHPFAAPDPSRSDIDCMARIASTPSSQCSRPVLLIVGGDPTNGSELRAFAFIGGRDFVELFKKN